ncbi:transporter substrate-binding domain-containing protein [Alkalimarinus coralli]|uniref:transporter substrate-binding domain-containing protein n=1 Tax=Alkalimarinus coralli TaxID=2935863 RepID=UPI00202B3707|nr:transporter substrate-binding domain-containing protein [Alkalimarinus coralli]
MFKTITTLSALILLSLSTKAFSEEVHYLIVERLSEPFQLTQDGKSNGGIISDIVDKVFEDSPYTVKHHAFPLNRLYKMVESGEITNWIAYDAKVWNSLSKWGDFVDEPLFPVRHTYLTCSPNAPEQIDSASDINNHYIAVLKNFDYPELDELRGKEQLNLIPVSDYDQGISLTMLNRVNAFVEMDLRVRFKLKTASIEKPCLQFVDISHIIPAYSIYLTTDKNNQSGVNEYAAKRIKQLKQNGTIQKALSRYISVDNPLSTEPKVGLQ